MPFILLGNIASSLKFELISRKIKLVFLYAMELDTRELFRCLARDCNYRDENYVMFQKRIAFHETIYCSQSSEALGGFWSFAIMPMNIHKQAIEKKFLEVEFERQAVRTNPTISALRLCLHRRSNIYLHKLPFTVDLTDIKSWIVFKFR